MATLDYVEIPTYATRLQSTNRFSHDIRPAHKIVTSLPNPNPIQPTSPTKPVFNSFIPQIILSSSLHIPESPTPSNVTTTSPLLSAREPLSIPTTTVNFKRFVSKCGPVFWFQDRVEEVIMWRKGWKVTGVWMAVYAFLCYFPRMILLIPHMILIAIILSTHPSLRSVPLQPSKTQVPPSLTAPEGTIAWQANIQGIQNLMGAFSDLDDFFIHPFLPYITHGAPHTQIIFTLAVTSFVGLLLVLPILPMRTLALVGGLTPFVLTHPFVRKVLGGGGVGNAGWNEKVVKKVVGRVMDDDRLEDRVWNSELREVELWENERWSASGSGDVDGGGSGSGGWGKTYLRGGAERSAWTRGRDGWSGVLEDGNGDVSSNLTFSLSPGWSFVETEDWRPDLEAGWAGPGVGSDDYGWVYTNDAWLDPHAAPLDTWKSTGMTRRRRWIRRIYYSE